MTFQFNVQGERRKELANAIGTITGAKPVYQKAPTYNYAVGDYIVTKNGDVIVAENTDDRIIQELIDSLHNMGFDYIEGPDPTAEEIDAIEAEVLAEYAEEAAKVEYEETEEETDEESDDESDEETETVNPLGITLGTWKPAEDTFVESTEDAPEETAPETATEPPVWAKAPEDEPEAKEPEEASETPDVAPTVATQPEEAEDAPAQEDEPEEETEEAEPEEDDGITHITLSLPLEPFKKSAGSIDRMKAIVASKQSLLKRSLDTETLDIQTEDDKVLFPWFSDHGLSGEMDAYAKLVTAIAKMAITQKRVIATEKQNSDEKLAMRLFLIRLNFIGDEYKIARSILTRNFSNTANRGSSTTAPEFDLGTPEVYVPTPKKEDAANETAES